MYGLNVINPTSFDIQVSRIIFTAAANSASTTVFVNSCTTANILPSSGSWTCPATNVLMWADILNPILIPSRSIQAFFAQTDASAMSGSTDDPATLMTGTVYSSYGPANRIGVTTGIIDGATDGSIVQIYGTNTMTTADMFITGRAGNKPDLLQPTSVIGNITDQASGSTFLLNMTLSVLSENAGAGIEQGRMLINVPSGFAIDSDNIATTNPLPGTFAFGSSGVLVKTFSDGSQQVSANFTNLGIGAVEGVTIQIPLTAPIVTANAIYQFFGLAEGITEASAEHPIGPVAEFPVQINDCCP